MGAMGGRRRGRAEQRNCGPKQEEATVRLLDCGQTVSSAPFSCTFHLYYTNISAVVYLTPLLPHRRKKNTHEGNCVCILQETTANQ